MIDALAGGKGGGNSAVELSLRLRFEAIYTEHGRSNSFSFQCFSKEFLARFLRPEHDVDIRTHLVVVESRSHLAAMEGKLGKKMKTVENI